MTSLLDLPPELLEQVFLHLTTHDLTVCARINRTWYQCVIEEIWHTFDLGTSQTAYRKFKNAYFVSGMITQPDAAVSLAKNLNRIRVLRIQHISLLSLFAQAVRVTEKDRCDPLFSLQELDVDFVDDSAYLQPLDQQEPQPWSAQDRHISPFAVGYLRDDHSSVITEEKKRPLDLALESAIQILACCSRGSLSKFTVSLASMTLSRGNANDQVRLWASLPTSLEQLIIRDDPHAIIQDPSEVERQHTKELVWSSVMTTSRTGEVVDFGPLTRLKTISVTGRFADMRILGSVLKEKQCGPALEELNLVHTSHSLDDTSLCQLVSMAGGLKTFAYDSISEAIGPLTTAAILGQAKTLENIRVDLGGYGSRGRSKQGFTSVAIQRLLCSAPNLRRFDALPSEHQPGLEPNSFLAQDILESSENWACLNLESFKCRIGDIPPTDLKRRSNGRRLRGQFHDTGLYTQVEIRAIQCRILDKFSQLTKLREFSFHWDMIGPV
ncbi:hypothetical protein BGZ83_011345 [Gryganskiella cystojenkinii]|nr:hypothetical protein BGZ83_011345 [Gryganskiella cystojenkinii]